ncbi:MAG: hypothetical protein FWJ74_13445, partial [Gemmatimonadota bacterium]
MRILARVREDQLRRALQSIADARGAVLVDAGPFTEDEFDDAIRAAPDVVVVESGEVDDLSQLRAETDGAGSALIIACHDSNECQAAALANADEWILLPCDEKEIDIRITTAQQRAEGIHLPRRTEETVERFRYQELLYDRLTG